MNFGSLLINFGLFVPLFEWVRGVILMILFILKLGILIVKYSFYEKNI